MQIFRKTIFNFLLRSGIYKLFLKKNEFYILCLHRISNEFSPGYPPMKIDMFSQIMDYINSNFEVISFNQLDEINSTYSTKTKKLIITFDDGYLDFKTNALPILNKYNFPVTVNLITDVLDNGEAHWTQKLSSIVEKVETKLLIEYFKDEYQFKIINSNSIEKIGLEIFNNWKKLSIDEINKRIHDLLIRFELERNIFIPMMKWNDIEEISSNYTNVTWGCHTQSHLNLTDCSVDNILEKEIVISKQTLETGLNTSINVFAFPNGDYTIKSMEKAKKNYDFILLTEPHKLRDKVINRNKIYFRNQLYYNTFSENILKMYGLHNIFKRK